MKRFFDPQFPFSPSKSPFFYGWWILVISSLGIVASIPGQTMGFSVFNPILSKTLGISASELSIAYLVGTLSSGFLLPQVGKTFDNWGARKMVFLICIFMGVGLLYLSQVDHLAEKVATTITFVPSKWVNFFAIALGFFWLRFSGQGALTMTSRSMLGKWFNHKRGIALSISGIITSFSFSLAPRVFDIGIDTFGWRGVWSGLGFIMIFGTSIFFWLFSRDNPEECHLEMDGEADSNTKKSKNEDLIIYREFTRSEALKTPSFWIFNLALGLFSFAYTGYSFHVVSVAEDLHVARETLLQAFVPASVIGITVSLIGGAVSSKIRMKYLLAVKALGGAIFCCASVFQLQNPEYYIIAGMGICNGTFGILSGMIWPRFFGRKHLGAISSVGMATLVYTSAAAPVCYSISKDRFGSYQPIFTILMLAYLVSFVSAYWADNPQRKLKPSEQ